MIELNKIHCGDCIELLKQIEDNSVDLVVTDPPYGIQYHSGRYKDINPHSPIVNDDMLYLPIDELWRILKPSGAVFSFYSHKVPLTDKRVRNTIIWVKNNWTAGDLYADFGNQYECIAFMPKSEFKLKSYRYSNVWHFDRIQADKLQHPTQKPLSIIRRIISSSSTEGNLIIDPFIGSGTTAVACKQLNRNFIGIEINPEYVKIANKRLEQSNLLNLIKRGRG